MYPVFTNGEYAAICVALVHEIEKMDATLHFFEEVEKPLAEEILKNLRNALRKIQGDDSHE